MLTELCSEGPHRSVAASRNIGGIREAATSIKLPEGNPLSKSSSESFSLSGQYGVSQRERYLWCMSLQPEKRVDKNGRTVTRHVRKSSPTEGAVKIPPPQISQIDPIYLPMKTLEQLAFYEVITMHGSSRAGSLGRNLEMQRWRQEIPSISQKVMQTALPVLSSYAHDPNIAMTVQDLIKNRDFAATEDDLCLQIRMAAMQIYYWNSDKPVNIPWIRWVSTWHVLAESGQDIDEDTPSEEQEEAILSLAHVLTATSVAGLNEYDLRSAVFNMELDERPEIVRVALDNPDRGEEIAAFIVDRGVADVGLINEFLGGSSPALNSGIL